jgi:divalent metal cation (Fe/Co/Zn/Cd) transporter
MDIEIQIRRRKQLSTLQYNRFRKALAVGLTTLVVNIVLMLIKVTVGLVGNSYALVADGIESAGDIFYSVVA